MANFYEKTFIKSEYLTKTETSLITSKVIWAFQVGYIDISDINKAIYIIKALMFSSNVALAKSFLLMIST